MKKTVQIEQAIEMVQDAIDQTTEYAIGAAIDALPEYNINPEFYNAYKQLFAYIYPKTDINVWSPEMMELITIISRDSE
jgi:hypothetical protein